METAVFWGKDGPWQTDNITGLNDKYGRYGGP